MERSELRRLLLEQHAELRALSAAVEAAGTPGALRDALLRLAQALAAHNTFEEQELHAILPTVDAWGALRHGDMVAAHAAEHGALRASFAAAVTAEAARAATATLLAHMEAEERDFLGADVLRDDVVSTGISS